MTETANVALGDHGMVHHGKSFWLASRLLRASEREPVLVMYAWCRRADDAIDEAPPGAQRVRLAELREELARAYGGKPSGDPVLDAFARLVRRHQIPRDLPEALLDGMEMDVCGHRYETWGDLLRYCYRVASTVGLMLCRVLGATDPRAKRHAIHLGLAMQLTNIARDVREDHARGRVYLPAELLLRHGLDELSAEEADFPHAARDRCRFAVAELLEVADRYYASADEGLRYLPLRAALAVAAARSVYAQIGRVIARGGHDVLAPRAVVPRWQKLLLCARAIGRALLGRSWWRKPRSAPPGDAPTAPNSHAHDLIPR